MPRKPRIEYPGALYYVSARGRAADPLYQDREDSETFLSLLGAIATELGWQVYSFALMPDRYHLVIGTPQPNLARGMQRLNGRFAQWANNKRGTAGPLLQGRYKATLAEREAYLSELVRWCALAPVRAGLAERPEQWIWGAYRTLIGRGGDAPRWLAVGEIAALFERDNDREEDTDWAMRLQHFVSEAERFSQKAVQDFERLLERTEVLGSRSYLTHLTRQLALEDVPHAAEPQSLAAFKAQFMPREKAMAAASLLGGYRGKEIAEAFDLHPSAVSRARARYKAEILGEAEKDGG